MIKAYNIMISTIFIANEYKHATLLNIQRTDAHWHAIHDVANYPGAGYQEHDFLFGGRELTVRKCTARVFTSTLFVNETLLILCSPI